MHAHGLVMLLYAAYHKMQPLPGIPFSKFCSYCMKYAPLQWPLMALYMINSPPKKALPKFVSALFTLKAGWQAAADGQKTSYFHRLLIRAPTTAHL